VRLAPLVLTLLALPFNPPLLAQQWSSQEQEVLDNLTECWDIWMAGIRSGSPDQWISQCTAPGMTYWGAQDGAPDDPASVRRNWEMISRQDLGWVDMRPVSLVIAGDVAVLHFYGYWRAPDGDGELVTEAKRTEVFRRLDGRWKMIAGHATPVSLADAAPYRRSEN